MQGRAIPLIPLVNVFGFLEDGVPHPLPHGGEVSVPRVAQQILLVGHFQRRQARLAGHWVTIPAHAQTNGDDEILF